MEPRKARKFSQEFKQEAVKLVKESGRPILQIARELGISDSVLHKWIKLYGGSGSLQHRTEEQQEIARLKRELARVTEEREILKKAAAYFATVTK